MENIYFVCILVFSSFRYQIRLARLPLLGMSVLEHVYVHMTSGRDMLHKGQ